MTRRALAAIGLAVLIGGGLIGGGLAGCGGSSRPGGKASTSTSGSVADGRPLTDVQALALSRILLKDGQAGGASFVVDLPSRGAIVAHLTGEVDWAHHLARATYAPTAGGAETTEYEWNRSIVLVGGIPGLEAAMAAQGRPGVTWVSRPLDPTTAPLDGVLSLFFALSSDRPDNPQLLTQAGARYLGRRTYDGASLDGYRYGANTTYWVGPADGLLRRVEARFRSFSDPVIVHLSDLGPRRPAQPQKSEVVDASTIPDLYRQLTGHAPR